MKNVYFVTIGLHGGGAERVMSVIANHLCSLGYQVNFIMLKNVPEEYKLDDRIIRYYKKESCGKGVLEDIEFIRSFMKKDSDGVYISFFTYQSFYTILASIGTGSKVIVSERNDPSKTVGNIIGEMIRNVLYSCRWCKKVVFQTQGAREYFGTAIKNKGIIILNPLKKEVENLKAKESIKEIVAVGRLTNQKNYPLMISSFAEFLRSFPDYVLRIFGQGELQGELVNLARKYGIEDKIVFEGFCTDVHEQMLRASMFVISSDYEGLSNALIEAMAIGLPCISTDSPPGGARMVITDRENGLLVPVGDSKKLTEAMLEIARNRDFALALGKKASEIKKIISEDAICEQWRLLIDEV